MNGTHIKLQRIKIKISIQRRKYIMSIKSQQINMKTIFGLVSQNLSYIYGERESGPNGAKKQFHTKSKAFLRTLGNDLGLTEFKVSNNHGGIAVSGEITLMGLWTENDGIYLQLSQCITGKQEFLYRGISHMKDHSGGPNQWMDLKLFKNGEYEEMVEKLLKLKKSTPTESVVSLNAA